MRLRPQHSNSPEGRKPQAFPQPALTAVNTPEGGTASAGSPLQESLISRFHHSSGNAPFHPDSQHSTAPPSRKPQEYPKPALTPTKTPKDPPSDPPTPGSSGSPSGTTGSTGGGAPAPPSDSSPPSAPSPVPLPVPSSRGSPANPSPGGSTVEEGGSPPGGGSGTETSAGGTGGTPEGSSRGVSAEHPAAAARHAAERNRKRLLNTLGILRSQREGHHLKRTTLFGSGYLVIGAGAQPLSYSIGCHRWCGRSIGGRSRR